MMAGAFLYLPDKYQSKGVQEIADGFSCVEWRVQEEKTSVVGMGRMASTSLL